MVCETEASTFSTKFLILSDCVKRRTKRKKTTKQERKKRKSPSRIEAKSTKKNCRTLENQLGEFGQGDFPVAKP